MPTDPPPATPVVSPSPADSDAEAARGEQRALGWAAIAAVAAIVWIVMPVGVGILLGTLLGFALQPVFEQLKPRLGVRGSALTIVLGSVIVLAATLGGLSWLFVARGVTLARQWAAWLGSRGSASEVFSAVGGVTGRFGVSPNELAARARALAESGAERVAGVAEDIVATTAGGVLALFFAMLSMHFILRNWQVVTMRAREALPLRPDYTAALFEEFQRVGRSTLLGTVGTGFAQGLLATLGYWIAGVPEPLFFGTATAVASLVPAVGAALVWAPVGVALILTGDTTHGVLELVWGAGLVAAMCDYVIRPRLVGGAGTLPSLVTFTALLGGAQVFGLKGLIVGPVLMSLAIAVLRLYATEVRARRLGRLERAGAAE